MALLVMGTRMIRLVGFYVQMYNRLVVCNEVLRLYS